MLKELFSSHPDGKRDYLFYLAIGNARIKEYNKALHYVKAFLEIEPANQQVLALEVQIISYAFSINFIYTYSRAIYAIKKKIERLHVFIKYINKSYGSNSRETELLSYSSFDQFIN